MADATDSKSVVGDNVWVQVPPSAPEIAWTCLRMVQAIFLRGLRANEKL